MAALLEVSAARRVASATRRARSALADTEGATEVEGPGDGEAGFGVGAGTGAATIDAPASAFLWNSASRAATSARFLRITSLSAN